jgi:hypothetical protein
MTIRPDVVIPYRRSRSDELIYALRSLKNVPHGEVFVIGDDPGLNVHYIPYRQSYDIAKNTLSILNLAVNTQEISEDFIWMADDTYIMQPIRRIPVMHRGTYDKILERYQNKVYNYYVQRMIKTNTKLKELGIESPLCYELHVPFVVNKKKWLQIAEHITPDLNKLSMYGNLCKLGGTRTRDVKVRQKDWVPEGVFASSHERTFGSNSLGKKVREQFGERSVYEK